MDVSTEERTKGGRAKRIFRSIAAVIGGSIAIGIASFAADYAMARIAPDVFAHAGRNSNPMVLAFIAAYSIVFSGLGGYVTAWIANRAPMKHVIALAVLQLLGGIGAALQAGNLLPTWFYVAVVVLPVPAILLGGMLKSRTS